MRDPDPELRERVGVKRAAAIIVRHGMSADFAGFDNPHGESCGMSGRADTADLRGL